MADEEGQFSKLSEHLIHRVVELGINAGDPLPGAVEVGEENLTAASGDRPKAIRRLGPPAARCGIRICDRAKRDRFAAGDGPDRA